MTKRINILLVVAVSVGALLATAGLATAAPAKKASVVPIIMKDPGCHWFSVGGKTLTKYRASGPTEFQNLDEATLIFKGKGLNEKVPVGKSITLTTPGVYHITMVGQAPDDNHLKFFLK